MRDKIALIAESFARIVRRPLLTADGDAAGGHVVDSLWRASFVIVAHGTEPDPVFFFGNRCALDTFGYSLEEFTRLPSQMSAEAPERAERQRMLARVMEAGFIDDYSGIRVTRTGQRFPVTNGIVWNLTDLAGRVHGQAATFGQ